MVTLTPDLAECSEMVQQMRRVGPDTFNRCVRAPIDAPTRALTVHALGPRRRVARKAKLFLTSRRAVLLSMKATLVAASDTIASIREIQRTQHPNRMR